MPSTSNFIDVATIWLHAGKGGDGAVSFHREKFVAAGGPDGGDGGRGGNIVFQADPNLSTLMDFRYKRKYTAPDGENGRGARQKGKDADDLVIRVPRGTVLKEAETGLVVADLSGDAPVVVAKGGRGGWGNARFATPTRQIPRFAKPGLPGEDMHLTLELKVIADVSKGLPIEIPRNYYVNDDPDKGPLVRWRGHANLLFSNWLNYFVYQETPLILKISDDKTT